jgi:NADP-dependent 3-hydroxy acid dehydrogenase YdfG
MPSRLANKWVLITGASSGFGAAAARAFAAEGCNLILGARRTDRLEAVAAEARKLGAPTAVFHKLDVSSTSSVNNAGGAHGLDTVANGKDEDWEAMVQVNLLGVMRVTRAILPYMVKNPGSYILNIGSVAGRQAYEGGSVYCGVKAAEIMITRSLRLELNGTGVRVGTIDPGMAETEFSMVRFKGDEQRSTKVYEGVVPLTANDIAEILVWCASRPPHVCIDELLVKCTDQAAVHKLYRRPVGK